jgi:NDP-sugar pyrophosphorylase family protein
MIDLRNPRAGAMDARDMSAADEMHGRDDTGVVILAGGRGTRLSSVVSGRPKVLADVCGRPFLAYLLDQLSHTGIADVLLCTGYRGDQVRAAFGGAHGPLHLRYSQEATPLGTGGALRQALPLLPTPRWLVLNGDSFCDADLRDVLGWHRRCNAQVTLVLSHVSEVGRFGQVEVDEQGRVVRFAEKGAGRGAGWISAGIYVIERAALATLPAAQPCSLEREFFPAWIGRGLFGYRHDGRFLDIGLPETLRAASRFFAEDPAGAGV